MATEQPAFKRRELARELSKASRASASDILSAIDTPAEKTAYRIGVTGPPGAGKSTLLAKLAANRVAANNRIGILAIDPSSPVSGGSILGDRIRMDEIADCPDLYIRSFPSGSAVDGLTSNVAQMLRILDNYRFNEVFVETVGVGQIDYAISSLVDTVVLVLVPESGDSVQAMKAGLLEMADIYVVNKADRPGAEKMRTDIETVLGFTKRQDDGWNPKVLMTSAQNDDLNELDAALNSHQQWARAHRDPQTQLRKQRRHEVLNLLQRRVSDINQGAASELFDEPLSKIMDYFVKHLAD